MIALLSSPPGAWYSDQIVFFFFTQSNNGATISSPDNDIFWVFLWMIEYLPLKFLHIKVGLPKQNSIDFCEVLMGNSAVQRLCFLKDYRDGWTFLAVWRGEYQMHYFALRADFKQLGIYVAERNPENNPPPSFRSVIHLHPSALYVCLLCLAPGLL